MDVATARVDEPVPPPDASALLGGAAPGGAAGEPAATSGGDGGAVGGGASAAARPTLTVPAAVPAAAMPAAAVAPPPAAAAGASAAAPGPATAPAVGAVPVAVAAADDGDGTAGAGVAEAAAPTAGEAGLCTLRFLLANSTEFRISAPPETTIRDIKTQIITQHPPQVSDFLRASQLPPVVSTEEMRILHLGKFLDDPRKLADYSFAVGGNAPGDPTDGVTAVHLLCKPLKAAAEEAKERPPKGPGCCCSLM
ncbi:hypothetical protein BU14_2192s0001 [Porphyra umbilicalis]|uniref:UBL3-like ubiquitin domain-containing protein n=1 Tax=Porphyra umbilicalis TaxID=2786 RepID=A0A1X6NKE9_PORUM|nr:hypothetical protein BU14_2192s0001 [Porphyra umbilicalis]|eukprot:OSX68833.1 hypothetical protein BU14_2192s0001 [Porphyra umbilicalis]